MREQVSPCHETVQVPPSSQPVQVSTRRLCSGPVQVHHLHVSFPALNRCRYPSHRSEPARGGVQFVFDAKTECSACRVHIFALVASPQAPWSWLPQGRLNKSRNPSNLLLFGRLEVITWRLNPLAFRLYSAFPLSHTHSHSRDLDCLRSWYHDGCARSFPLVERLSTHHTVEFQASVRSEASNFRTLPPIFERYLPKFALHRALKLFP